MDRTDARGAAIARRMEPISGVLLLQGTPPAGAVYVRVALRDASRADAPSTELAVLKFRLPGPVPQRIPFLLQPPPMGPQPHGRWLFDATVSRRAGGHLAPGDFVLARSIEYLQGASASAVDLPLDSVT